MTPPASDIAPDALARRSQSATENAAIDLRRATAADVAAVTALQQAAYAPNREVIGGEPLPLRFDYADIVRDKEVWLAHAGGVLAGMLILEQRPDELHIWSVSVAPQAQSAGIGNRLLDWADAQARALGLSRLSLLTAERLTRNVAWYQRHGYAIERIEQLADRRAVHMQKTIEPSGRQRCQED